MVAASGNTWVADTFASEVGLGEGESIGLSPMAFAARERILWIWEVSPRAGIDFY